MADQFQRIDAILGDSRERGFETAVGAFFRHLREHLVLPCEVTGIEDFQWEERFVIGPGDPKEYARLKSRCPSYKDRFELLAIEKDVASPWMMFAGEDIAAQVRRQSDGKEFTLGLAELKAVDKRSANYCLLHDYAVFFLNYPRTSREPKARAPGQAGERHRLPIGNRCWDHAPLAHEGRVPERARARLSRRAVSAARLDQMIADATVDCHDEEEQLTGFYTMLEEHLRLPFRTTVLGVEVLVEAVDVTDSGEIIAVCSRGRTRQPISILDIPLAGPRPVGWEWIEAYRRWARGRSGSDDPSEEWDGEE
jgi:hypothetical protein